MLIEKKLPIFLKKSDPLSYQKMLSFLITMLLKLLLNMMNLWKCYGRKSKRYIFYNKCVQVFCKHKDLPFSLTECFVKKVLESFYGECTPINYISGSAKKQYPYRFEEALSAQFQIRSRKETSFSMSTKTANLIFNKILETLFNLEML